MRIAVLAVAALAGCQSDLDLGETWASEEDSFSGIMAVLQDGLRPCTVEVGQAEMQRRVLEACRAAGLPRYPPGQTEPPVDMHLVFERVILHRDDVLSVRCLSIHPDERRRANHIVVREEGIWNYIGSRVSNGEDFPPVWSNFR